jgi:hypothetical protein
MCSRKRGKTREYSIRFDHVQPPAVSQVIRQYCELLKDYKTRPVVTENVLSFLELIVERCELSPMLFQLSVFCLFSEILNKPETEAVSISDRHGVGKVIVD